MTEYQRAPEAIEEALVVYARTPVVIRRATTDLPDARARVSPGEGEWSVAQIVMHLWTVDGHALVTFAGAEAPTEQVMEPQTPPSFGALMDEFELRRATVVAALRNLPPDLWDVPYPFRTVERTARELVTGFARHDADHVQQIIAARHAVELIEQADEA